MLITCLNPTHAPAAARLHIAGQPGTFLTSLGPEVLAVLYRTLPASPAGFGFAAVANDEPLPADVVGFVSATTGVGRLFLEMGTRRLGEFLPPLLACFVRRPALLLRSAQTVLYPLLAHAGSGPRPAAELLSIMVEPAFRGQGVGALLLQALVHECRRRNIAQLTVTVDASNHAAMRFYLRHGFVTTHDFTLYGRRMASLARLVWE